ncbi:MAG: cupin domain-containing protein [Candidatus Omnitrophica bacterium]|nr:cupin domain-containing protein [Candidatus Omnitrophota bacterium]
MDIKAKVFKYGDLIDYQEGSVVSRAIIDKESTVTVFAFDKDQGLSEHTAPFDALVNVVDGRAEVTIAGEKHGLSAGESIIMPADVPHSVSAPERVKMVLVMIRK